MRGAAGTRDAHLKSAVSTPQSPVFRLTRAGVVFGRVPPLNALAEVSLAVHAGERIALIGANGCGKSTLLRLLHGLLMPSVGEVWRAPRVAHAMVFQRPHMLRTSALNNVAMGPWLRGVRWREAKALALAALQRVGLEGLGQRAASKLSSGQQQRLALARACALSPQVLFLDEPTSSLDPHAKREVEALVQQLAREDPYLTLVFASHNLGQVKRLASRVIYLEQGRVLADLSVADFFSGQLLQTHYAQAHVFVKGEFV